MGLLPDIKGRVTGFILEYLGQYLDGLDKKQLRLKLWQGDLVINDVRLRASAFDELLQDVGNVPLCLLSGTVDSLHLKVPWSALKRESVVVTLSGVQGVVAPCKAKKWDHNAWLRRKKEASLARWEASRDTSSQQAAAADSADDAKDTWVTRLKNVILENLQVVIKDVHLRGEDCVSSPTKAAFFGVKLDSIGVAATTADGESEVFVHNPEVRQAFKILHVENLLVYVSPDTHAGLSRSWHLSTHIRKDQPQAQAQQTSWWRRREAPAASQVSETQKDGAELRAALGGGIAAEDVVLQPISCRAKVVIQKAGAQGDTPLATTRVHLPRLDLCLDKAQYDYLMQFSRFLACETELLSRTSLLALRPPPLCRPSLNGVPAEARKYFTEDCRAWWRFAIHAVVQQTKKRSRAGRRAEAAATANEEDIQNYIKLHTKVASQGHGVGALTAAELAAYNALQTCLPLETLVSSRRTVYLTLQKDTSPSGRRASVRSDSTPSVEEDDKDSDDGEPPPANGPPAFVIDCRAEGCRAVLRDARGVACNTVTLHLEDLQGIFRGARDGYNLRCVLYNASATLDPAGGGAQQVLVSQRQCGGGDVALSDIYEQHVVSTAPAVGPDTGEPLLYVEMSVSHADATALRKGKTVTSTKCTLGALVVVVEPDTIGVVAAYIHTDMSNTPNFVTNGLGSRVVDFAEDNIRKSFDSADIMHVVSLQLDITAPCLIANWRGHDSSAVVALGRFLLRDSDPLHKELNTYTYTLEGLRVALCGGGAPEHVVYPVGLAGTFRPETLRDEASDVLVEVTVQQVAVHLSKRSVCALAGLLQSYEWAAAAAVPSDAPVHPPSTAPAPAPAALDEPVVSVWRQSQRASIVVEGVAVCFKEMDTASSVCLCIRERSTIEVILKHDASCSVAVHTGRLQGIRCTASEMHEIESVGGLPCSAHPPFVTTEALPGGIDRIGVSVTVPPQGAAGVRCPDVSVQLGHVRLAVCKELVFFIDFLCRMLRALEVLMPSDSALAVERPPVNPKKAAVSVEVRSAVLDLRRRADDVEKQFLVANTHGIKVHVDSYEVGVDVGVDLKHLDLKAVDCHEALQHIAQCGLPDDANHTGGHSPLSISVQTPGPLLPEDQLGSGVKCHSATVQISAVDAFGNFYFPQFDSVIDYFLVGYVDQLICLPDMFQLETLQAVFSAPLDRPLPPPTKTKGPPLVKVSLKHATGKLPLSEDSKIGVHATVDEIDVLTTMSYEREGIITEPSACTPPLSRWRHHVGDDAGRVGGGPVEKDAQARGLLWASVAVKLKGVKVSSNVGRTSTFLDCDVGVGVENLIKIDGSSVKHTGFRLYLDLPNVNLNITRYEYVMLLDVIFFNFLNTPPPPLPTFTSFATSAASSFCTNLLPSEQSSFGRKKVRKGEAQFVHVNLGPFAAQLDKVFGIGGRGLAVTVRRGSRGAKDVHAMFPNLTLCTLGLQACPVTQLLTCSGAGATVNQVHVSLAPPGSTAATEVEVAVGNVGIAFAQESLMQLQEILLNDDSLYAIQSFIDDGDDATHDQSDGGSDPSGPLAVSVSASQLSVSIESLSNAPLLAVDVSGASFSLAKSPATTRILLCLKELYATDLLTAAAQGGTPQDCILGPYSDDSQCPCRTPSAAPREGGEAPPAVDLQLSLNTTPSKPNSVFLRVPPTSLSYRHLLLKAVVGTIGNGPLSTLVSTGRARAEQASDASSARGGVTHLDIEVAEPRLVVPSMRRGAAAEQSSLSRPTRRSDELAVVSLAGARVKTTPSATEGGHDTTTAALQGASVWAVTGGMRRAPVVQALDLQVCSSATTEQGPGSREEVTLALPQVAVRLSPLDVAVLAHVVAGNLGEAGHDAQEALALDAALTPHAIPETPEIRRLAAYLGTFESRIATPVCTSASSDSSQDEATEDASESIDRRESQLPRVISSSVRVVSVTATCPELCLSLVDELFASPVLSLSVSGVSYQHRSAASVEYSEVAADEEDSAAAQRQQRSDRREWRGAGDSFADSTLTPYAATRLAKKKTAGPWSNLVEVTQLCISETLDGPGAAHSMLLAEGGGDTAAAVHVTCAPPAGPQVSVKLDAPIALRIAPPRVLRLADALHAGQVASEIALAMPPAARHPTPPPATRARSPMMSPLSLSTPPSLAMGPATRLRKKRPRKARPLFSLDVAVPTVSVSLLEELVEETLDGGTPGAPLLSSIALLKLGNSHLSLRQPEGRVATMKGRLGNLQIYDDRPGREREEILGLVDPEQVDDSFIVVEYGPYERLPGKADEKQAFTERLTCVVHSLRLCCAVGFFMKLRQVASALASETAPLVDETTGLLAKEAKLAVASKSPSVSVSICIEHPLLALPDDTLLGSAMHIDLGVMTLENALEASAAHIGAVEEVLAAELRGCMVSALRQDPTGGVVSTPMLEAPIQVLGRGCRRAHFNEEALTSTNVIYADVEVDAISVLLSEAVYLQAVSIAHGLVQSVAEASAEGGADNLDEAVELTEQTSLATAASLLGQSFGNDAQVQSERGEICMDCHFRCASVQVACFEERREEHLLSVVADAVHFHVDTAPSEKQAGVPLRGRGALGVPPRGQQDVGMRSAFDVARVYGTSACLGATTEVLDVKQFVVESSETLEAEQVTSVNIELDSCVTLSPVWLAVSAFVVAPIRRLSLGLSIRKPQPLPAMVVKDDMSLQEDLVLGHDQYLRVACGEVNTVTINGNGHRLVLIRTAVDENTDFLPIFVEDKMLVIITNCVIELRRHMSSLSAAHLSPTSSRETIDRYVCLDGPSASLVADRQKNKYNQRLTPAPGRAASPRRGSDLTIPVDSGSLASPVYTPTIPQLGQQGSSALLTSFSTASPGRHRLDGRTKIVKVVADIRLQGRLALEHEATPCGFVPLVLLLEGRADASRRSRVRNGATLQLLGTFSGSRVQLQREDGSATLLDRMRLDAFFRSGSAPRGKKARKGKPSQTLSLEILGSDLTSTVSYTDLQFVAMFSEAMRAAAANNSRIYTNVSVSAPKGGGRARSMDHPDMRESGDSEDGADIVESSSINIEFKSPSFGILFVDDSSRDINLPLYEVKLMNVAANIEHRLRLRGRPNDELEMLPSSNVRVSFVLRMNHYNSTCCEWEAVLEKAPLGLVLDLPSPDVVSLSLTGAKGLSFVVTPSLLTCIRHTVDLMNRGQHQLAESDTESDEPAAPHDKQAAHHHQHPNRCPTQICNTLPEPVLFDDRLSLTGDASIDSATVVKPQERLSLLSSGIIALRHPYARDAWHSINTSNLGCTQLSEGVVCDCKLQGGVKVLTIKTLLTITNALQESLHVDGLGELPPQEAVSLPQQRVGERLRIHRRGADPDANSAPHMLPALPYSEIVHNCLNRGGAYELPLSHESGYFLVVHAVRESLTGRVELTIFPSFEVQNLTGRRLSLDFHLHPQGELFARTSLDDGRSLQLTNLDPTSPLYVNPRVEQPGGEVLLLGTSLPVCIKRGARTSALQEEAEVISTTLTPLGGTGLPLAIDTSYPLSGRQAQLTCKYWLVNHTEHDFHFVHKGCSVVCPAKSDSPVLFSPPNTSPSAAASAGSSGGDTSQDEQVIEGCFRLIGAEGASSDSVLLPLHVLGAEGTVGIRHPDDASQQVIAAYRTAFSGGKQGYRTRVIEILPRWACLNATAFPTVLMRTSFGEVELQKGVPQLYHAHPVASEGAQAVEQRVSFHVADGEAAATSCHINIMHLGEVTFKLPVTQGSSVTYEYVTCSMKGDPTGYISLKNTVAPFVVVNRTPYSVSMWQQDCADRRLNIARRESHTFGWDDASGRLAVQVEVFGHTSDPIDLFDTDREEPVLRLPSFNVYLQLLPTKDDRVAEVVLFSDPLLATRSSQIVRLVTSSDTKNMGAKIDLARLSVSLVRQEEMREVACLTLHGLFVQGSRGMGQDVLQVGVQNVQLDDMSETKPLFPVVVSSFEGQGGAQFGRRSIITPQFLTFSAIRKTTSELLHFPAVTLAVNPISICVGDRFLWEIFEFKREVSVALGLRLAPSKCHTHAYYIKRCHFGAAVATRRVDYDLLEISPIVITITVDRLKEGRDPYRDRLGLGNFALALPSVKDGMVSLGKLSASRGRDTVGMLGHRIGLYYAKEFEASHNLAGIIGRIQAIGNPLGLFSNVTTGVKDFVVLPAMGLMRSPGEFGAGVIMGTGSLVGKSVGGVLGTVAGITRGGARVFESCADTDWRMRRAIDAKGSKRNPFEVPVKGVFDGVVGLVKEPVVGAMTGGAVGGIVGAGKGILGVVAKPVSGVLNGISDTATLLERTVLLKSSYDRVREPRYFDPESQAQPAPLQYHETYENQRWYIGVGWVSNLLPVTDHPKWSTVKGKASTSTEEYVLPAGQVWVGQWSLDAATTGKDGWSYAMDFESGFHDLRHELDFVRRRRWIRPSMIASEMDHEPPVGDPSSPRTDTGMASPFIALEQRVAVRLAHAMRPRQQESAYSNTGGAFAVVEATENQKYRPGIGWSAELDLTDCWRWSDRSGAHRCLPKEQLTPPEGHIWASPWEPEGGGKHGWNYSDDFSGTFSHEVSATSKVRRRHWVRRARHPVPSPERYPSS